MRGAERCDEIIRLIDEALGDGLSIQAISAAGAQVGERTPHNPRRRR